MSRRTSKKPPLWDKVVSDAARRASDAVNLHLAANDFDAIKDKFLAIRLSDGSTDNVLYDSKQDAVRHVPDESWYAFICFRNIRAGSSARGMQVFLDMNRKAYDAGMRLSDPDMKSGGPDLLPESPLVDRFTARQQILQGLAMAQALEDSEFRRLFRREMP